MSRALLMYLQRVEGQCRKCIGYIEMSLFPILEFRIEYSGMPAYPCFCLHGFCRRNVRQQQKQLKDTGSAGEHKLDGGHKGWRQQR